MPITLYGLKNCDTCRKALKALDAKGHTVTFISVRDEAVVPDDIARWEMAIGWKSLLNTRSTTWRSLGEDEKSNVTLESALRLMGTHRALIKRPVIEKDGAVFLGWKTDVQNALL